MVDVLIEKIDEVWVRIKADPSIKMEVSEKLTFFVNGYKHMPKYKFGQWDGKIRLVNSFTGIFYYGLVEKVVDILDNLGYSYSISEDLLKEPKDNYDWIFSNNKLEPRNYQIDAAKECIDNDRKLLLCPTASGKSFIIYLIAKYHLSFKRRVLIITPLTQLVSQLGKDFIKYSNDELDIHQISAGADKNIQSDIVISTWQSIYKLGKDWFNSFDVVIADEAHSYQAKELTGLFEKTTLIHYKYGLTGSLDNSLSNKLTLIGIFGPVHKVIDTKELIDNGTLADFKIKILVLEHLKAPSFKVYKEEIEYLISLQQRNQFIKNLCKTLNGNSLVLFQFVEKHGEVLVKLFEDIGKTVHFIHGGVPVEQREKIKEIVETTTNNIIIASYGSFSTGVNIVNLDNLILGSPLKSKIKNLQSIGRVLRKGDEKSKATLYDIIDNTRKKRKNFALLHGYERIKIYDEEGFDYKVHQTEIS